MASKTMRAPSILGIRVLLPLNCGTSVALGEDRLIGGSHRPDALVGGYPAVFPLGDGCILCRRRAGEIIPDPLPHVVVFTSTRLKPAMKMKADRPRMNGRIPFALSLAMSVSRPMAASAIERRKVVAGMITLRASGGMVTTLLAPTRAMNPRTNQGRGGLAWLRT